MTLLTERVDDDHPSSVRVCRTLCTGRADAVLRKTVPAAMSAQVEADVTVERCEQPQLPFAQPNLPDSEYP